MITTAEHRIKNIMANQIEYNVMQFNISNNILYIILEKQQKQFELNIYFKINIKKDLKYNLSKDMINNNI